jgi:hypothetical protein
MVTNPRPWPNNAKEIRDLAAEIAIVGRRGIEPLLTRQFTKAETIRRLAIAIVSFQKISRLLESVGAQTNPLDDFD